jgi:Zn-dependent metalloprotease
MTSDGYIRVLSAPEGCGFRASAAAGDSPAESAKALITEHARAFGATSDRVDFAIKRHRTRNNRHYVRLEQTYATLPVFAAEIVVQLNTAGQVEFALSDIARDTSLLDDGKVSTVPALADDQARELARDRVDTMPGGEDLRTSDPRLMIFDSSVIAEPGEVHLVWEVFVESRTTPEINEHLLIDAHDGGIVRHYARNRDLLDREIYDASNTSDDPGVLWRAEGDPAAGIVDVDHAYEYLGDAYMFYMLHTERNSLDDNGMTISATVRYCAPGSTCPYRNAFWRPGWFANRLYFGQDYAVQDIVAHEYSHGVTSFESNLVYENESGAINEFFSDAFGEFVDQRYVDFGHDGTSWNWQIGEDLPNGTIRDMSDPPNPPSPGVMNPDCTITGANVRQPDRKGSPYWYTGECDYGGVHINCGVGNKLCYLLTDGESFNGQTVVGMDIPNVAALLYEVNANLLPSGADYRDLGNAMQQAAAVTSFYWDWGPVRTQNNLYRALKAVEIAATDDIYVDAAYWGPEFGTELFPYNTVEEAYAAAYPGDRLRIKAGSYNETPSLEKIMKIYPRDGTVTIGR